MNNYPCTQCGACCRVAYLVEELPLAEDGKTCAHLEETTDEGGTLRYLCGIYETRPDICSIEKQIPSQMTRQQYFEVSAICCTQLQDRAGLDETYRVVLEPSLLTS